MKIQEEKIKCLLYDFVNIQKDILFNNVSVIDYKQTLKDFAVNICKLIDFKDLDIDAFNCLINKDVEVWSDKDDIDFSINNDKRYYRIEFSVRKGLQEGMGGRITILNDSRFGYYGYRVYFNKVTLKKKYNNAQVINGARVDEYLNGKTVKSKLIKIDRSFVTNQIYND